MLKITIDGQSLDLEGIRFTVQLNSPFPFDPTVSLIEGSFAFGAKFPASKRNKAIFGFPHRLEKYPESPADYSGYLFIDGRKLFDVIISMSEVTDFYFNANIKIGVGYFSNLIGDKTLQDLELGGPISLGTTTQDVIDHANASVALSYPAGSHCFPEIYNPLFYGEENEFYPEYKGFINFNTHSIGFAANYFDGSGIVVNENNLVPLFYLMFILEQCFREFGYNASGDFFSDDELAQLLVYNNRALDLIEDRFKVQADLSANQSVNETATIIFDRIISSIDDCYDETTGRFEIKSKGYYKILSNLSVEISVPGEYEAEYNLEIFQDGAQIHFQGGKIAANEPVDILVTHNQYFDDGDVGTVLYMVISFFDLAANPAEGIVYQDSDLLIQNMSESGLNRYEKTVYPQNHVPNIKISEFLIRIQKLFGIVYSFDHSAKQVEVLFIRDILNNFAAAGYDVCAVKSSKKAAFHAANSYLLNFVFPQSDLNSEENFLNVDQSMIIGEYATVDDLPASAEEGFYALISNLNSLYVFRSGAWAWYTDYFYPFYINSGKTEIKPDVSPMLMHWGNHPLHGTHFPCPRISQKGSGQLTGLNEFAFHLVFYRGLEQDSSGATYPFATISAYGPTGSLISSYELKWDGTYGLYEQFLREYYDFVINRSRPVEYDRYFTASEIRNVDFMEKVRIFQNTFLIKQISIPLSQSSIGVASMKLIKS